VRLARFFRSEVFRAAGAYLLLTLLLTWPLASGMREDFLSDLADPLLNAWILAWGSKHLLGFLGGDLGAFRGFWDAPIFHPHPWSLARSEHLFAQVVLVAPLYGLTGDRILSYNVLLVATFVLSALGAYLLVFDLTEDRRAAFLSGLFFGFAPYRFGQTAHLQVLSSEWMPFVLLGYRRFLATGRGWPLLGATIALLAQILSCAYYALFFPPFVAAWILFEMAQGGLLRSRRAWGGILLSAVSVLLLALPFLWPYAQLRVLEPNFARSLAVVEEGSADVYSYLTAPDGLYLWARTGALRALPRPEGALFPGLVPLLLAVLALWSVAAQAQTDPLFPRNEGPKRAARWALLVATGLLLSAAVYLVLVGPLDLEAVFLHARSLGHVLGCLAVSVGLLLALSPPLRTATARAVRSRLGFLVCACLVAVWLSLGPTPRSHGRDLGFPSLYGLLERLPGFDGARVPARYAMIVSLFLAVLGGLGAQALGREKHGHVLQALAFAFFLAEVFGIPLPVNQSPPILTTSRSGEVLLSDPDLNPTEPPGRGTPPVYLFCLGLPKDAVLAELPLGSLAWDARYMFYSTVHSRPLVNGYSGVLPKDYPETANALRALSTEPDTAILALRRTGATHVIVHEAAWRAGAGRRVLKQLEREGLREVARFDSDVVLAMPAMPLS
jgi:hypothetical protein